MNRRLLDQDGPIKQTWHYDELNDEAVIHSTMDVEPIINRNKELRNLDNGWSADRSMRHVATIDVVTYERWLREAFGDFWMQRPARDKMAVLKRRLNDPDFQNFRTVTVKL